MKEPFLSALPVLEKIQKSGYEAYFVGGSVRDFLLGKDIHDIDIATSATPEELKAIFPHTVDVGIAHGTILVLWNGLAFELTTYRTESDYKDYRHPESVSFVRSLEEDLKRRDFTMNAMAMDQYGTLIDPFEGQKALKNRVIQTVGSADERFQEDALRLMRAVRFVSQLGFQLDRQTEKAISVHAGLLQHIAVERVADEMMKLLSGPFKKDAFHILLQSGLYRFLPSLFNEEEVLESAMAYPISSLNENQLWVLALYFSNTSEGWRRLKRWKLPAKKMKRLVRALDLLKHRMSCGWTPYELFSAGAETAALVESLYRTIQHEEAEAPAKQVKEDFEKLPIQSRKELAVTGHDLMHWSNQEGGPWVKEVLEKIIKAVLYREVRNDKDEIRRWFEKCRLRSENN
ncbi:CCA tRNA nucleotidyltransferase [Siminovitchia sediminis]|uniref:CCA-adding enzyme n=1 Tax=Siminovitchia sediminis TaxID=1274353 RepID=A0ABW4KGU6_9BACI